MAASTHLNEYVTDPTTVKAHACLQTLIVADELGFSKTCGGRGFLDSHKKTTVSKRG